MCPAFSLLELRILEIFIIENYIFEDRVSASRRSGYARPTVNHLTVMNYVKLNSGLRPEWAA